MRMYTQGKVSRQPFCNFNSKSANFKYMADKLAAKLAGWKDRHVFLAGRTTLVKSVAMVVPPYVMHAFLLLVSMCDKLNRLSRHFLWGVAEEGKMYLFLRN